MKSYDNSTYKMPIRAQNSNKGTFGKVLNFAGSKNYIGAAYLSTVSILKCGGGFAALATEKDIIHSRIGSASGGCLSFNTRRLKVNKRFFCRFNWLRFG